MRTMRNACRVPLPQAIILLLHTFCFSFSHIYHHLKYFHLHTNRFFILIPHLCQMKRGEERRKRNIQYHDTSEEISIQLTWKFFVGKSMLMIALHVRFVKNDRCRRHHHYLVHIMAAMPFLYVCAEQSTAFLCTLQFYLSVSIKCLAQKCLR